MGQVTARRIADWQQRHGITAATGDGLELLERMRVLAFELIEVLALEKVGIRDGDGQWHGCDPIASIVAQLRNLEQSDPTVQNESQSWRANDVLPS